MRFRPQIEQLEFRETPSSFTPGAAVVSFAPSYYPGVPFSEITAPGQVVLDANSTGYDASGAALGHAGVFGAPAVFS